MWRMKAVSLCVAFLLAVWDPAAVAASEIPWAERLHGGWPPQMGDGFSAATRDARYRQQLAAEVDVARVMATVSDSFRQRLLTHAQGVGESQCQEDFSTLFKMKDGSNASKGTEALDALGKPGPYILQGNLHLTGSFDECLAIGEGLTQFCGVSLTLVVYEVYPLVPFNMDICVPKSCNVTDLESYISEVNTILAALPAPYKNYSIALTLPYNINCQKTKGVPYSPGAVAMIAVCALFLALAVVGTCVDRSVQCLRELAEKPEISALLRRRRRGPTHHGNGEHSPLLGGGGGGGGNKRDIFASLEKPLEFITAFSVYKNVSMILSTKQPPTAITSLNGIRVISMFWVILGHTHLWPLMSGSLTNPIYVLDHYTHRFSFQPIINGFFSVDSFFFLSGCLVSYLTLREMERKKGRFPFLTYYLHRYLRLTMVYAFLLFFWWNLTVHLGNGPEWRAALGEDSSAQKQCSKYWWTNLLYINNLYPWELAKECMGWSWYLANDMQFYVLAPIILIPLYHFFPVGLVISHVFIAATVATNGVIAGTKHFQANMFQEANSGDSGESDDIYVKPYTRAAPYLVGLVLGFVLYKRVQIKIHWLVDWLIYRAMWIVAAGCCFSVVYGLYSTWDRGHATTAENVLYFMLSRYVWAVGLALIVFTCHNGHGSFVNSFLSMKLWIPLSRLTYTAYLVHPIVLTVIFASLREPFTYTDYTLVVYSVAMVVLSFGAAGVVAVFVEFPLSNLEMAVFKAVGLRLREGTRHSGAANGQQHNKEPGGRFIPSQHNTPLASSPINEDVVTLTPGQRHKY